VSQAQVSSGKGEVFDLDGGVVDFVRKYELKDGGNRIHAHAISGGTTNPTNHLTRERVR
jgi:hypothetical protein